MRRIRLNPKGTKFNIIAIVEYGGKKSNLTLIYKFTLDKLFTSTKDLHGILRHNLRRTELNRRSDN